MRTLRFVLVTSLFLTLAVAANAQQKNAAQEKPCSTGYYRLLDFWVGDWALTWPDSPGGTPAGTGTNKILRTLDNCVIQELFEADKPVSLHGMSLSTFDKASGKWKHSCCSGSTARLRSKRCDRKSSARLASPLQRRIVVVAETPVWQHPLRSRDIALLSQGRN